MNDPFALERFVQAQDAVYARVLSELDAGRKSSHWMWFVFPQLAALGRSGTAQYYGISGIAEARAYWQHPLLGPRLRECCERTLAIARRSARQVFGEPDDLKFRSALTLFERAAPGEPVFRLALERYYGGERDPLTLRLLGEQD